MSTVDKSKLKDAILKTLIEKGDYASVLSHISGEEKEEKGNQLTNLIKPMSAVADILTENAKGAFMEDLEKRLDDATTKSSEELRSDLENAHKELQAELKTAIDTDRESLSQEVLNRIGDAQTKLQTTLATYADSIVTAKAQSMFADLGAQAKLTDAEISEIISSAALEVESQIVSIIGEYISEQGITVSQITDFKTEVQKLIPQVDFSNARINWGQIVGAPSQGGTNTNIVRQLIAEALASFSAGSGHTIEDEGTPLTQRDTLNFVGAGVTVTDAGGKTVVTIPGGGGGAVDSVNGQTGVVVLDADDISDTSTTNKFATAAEKTKLSNITVTQAVDLDAIETNANNVPAIKTKTDFITVTQSVDLDAIETNANNVPGIKTKTDFITVTQAVDLDTMESNIATNNAKPTISSGAGAPASTPTKVGDIYIDTTGDDAYIAVGTASSADWEKTNDGSGSGSPAGSDRQVQFNNAGAFGASSNVVMPSASDTKLKVTGATTGAFGYVVLAVENTDDEGRAELSLDTDDGAYAGFIAMGGSNASGTARRLDIGTRVNGPIGFWTNDIIHAQMNTSGTTSFFGDVTVPDDAYDATTWNGNTEVPTKNAIRDKIESMSAGSGITRTVVVTSGSATMGSSASTDYVYFVAGAHTMSMPAASGNTNRYTIKNNHSAAITVDTVGAETIDGTASIQIAPEDSVDIISNGTNFFVV